MIRTARLIMFGGAVGKVLGVLRELLTAALFGTGYIASAFRLSQGAFLLPSGISGDTVNGAFMPRFSQYVREKSPEAQHLFSCAHWVLAAFSLMAAAVMAANISNLVRFLAPGFDQQTALLAQHMVLLMIAAMPPYLLFGLHAAVDVCHGRGALVAARATGQTIGVIAGTLAAWVLHQPLLIAVGFAAAQYILFVWGVIVARRYGYSVLAFDLKLWRPHLMLLWRGARMLIWVPLLLQMQYVVERRVVSLVDVGGIAALDYARYAIDTLVYLFATPFAIAGLSSLALLSRDEREDAIEETFKLLMLIGVPSATVLANFGANFVEIFFARGEFGKHSVGLTAAVLQGSAYGMWAQLLCYVGFKYLSALGKNGSVLVLMALGVCITISFNLFTYESLGAASLGVAMSLQSIVLLPFIALALGVAGRLLNLIKKWAPSILLYQALALCLQHLELPGVLKLTISGAYWMLVLVLVAEWRASLIRYARGREKR